MSPEERHQARIDQERRTNQLMAQISTWIKAKTREIREYEAREEQSPEWGRYQ